MYVFFQENELFFKQLFQDVVLKIEFVFKLRLILLENWLYCLYKLFIVIFLYNNNRKILQYKIVQIYCLFIGVVIKVVFLVLFGVGSGIFQVFVNLYLYLEVLIVCQLTQDGFGQDDRGNLLYVFYFFFVISRLVWVCYFYGIGRVFFFFFNYVY